ncbi:hypothetical protein [Pleionea sp. CnH1-48]|uniref:hypothetical protein n=1 Tax=Pleionea sp. CnH1-48 TaxID=2954494 RepID=UPI002097AC8A|nr:hypothetical protein [Pleionea sp. CnH1-48]MCO7225760.1 hypothetical protein [Pleionea sp. CnH1-48]
MTNNKNVPFTTGAGRAVYPSLTQLDTKFDAEGIYKVDLVMSVEESKPLRDKIDKYLKHYVSQVSEKTGKKQDASKFRVPYELNDDGTYTVKLKQSGVINGDSVKLVFYDAKGKRIKELSKLYGGSTIKVAGTMRGYVNGANKGVTLGIYAVQVINLVDTYERDAEDFGFTAVDGFEFSEEGAENHFSASTSDDAEDFDF